MSEPIHKPVTPQMIARIALRWAWDQEILSQGEAEFALNWLDETEAEVRLDATATLEAEAEGKP